MATTSSKSPAPAQSKTKPLVKQPRFIICMIIVVGILALFVGISVHTQQSCASIVKNNTATMATVTRIAMFKRPRRYQTPPPTTDVGQAQTVFLYVTYNASGTAYNEKITASYKDHIALGALVGEAGTGQLAARYQTDKPSFVRPATEFTPQAIADKLCEQ